LNFPGLTLKTEMLFLQKVAKTAKDQSLWLTKGDQIHSPREWNLYRKL